MRDYIQHRDTEVTEGHREYILGDIYINISVHLRIPCVSVFNRLSSTAFCLLPSALWDCAILKLLLKGGLRCAYIR